MLYTRHIIFSLFFMGNVSLTTDITNQKKLKTTVLSFEENNAIPIIKNESLAEKNERHVKEIIAMDKKIFLLRYVMPILMDESVSKSTKEELISLLSTEEKQLCKSILSDLRARVIAANTENK